MPRQVAQRIGQRIPVHAELGRKSGGGSQCVKQILLALDPLEVGIEQREIRVIGRGAQLVEGGRLATVVAGPPGTMGSAEIMLKEGGAISGRPLFEAGTPSLTGFAPPARFTF